jgi:hypothetical protein
MNYLKVRGTYNLQNPASTTKFKAIINCIQAIGIEVLVSVPHFVIAVRVKCGTFSLINCIQATGIGGIKCATLRYRGKG